MLVVIHRLEICSSGVVWDRLSDAPNIESETHPDRGIQKMKRIAIMAAMGLLLAFGADAQAQSGTSADIGAISGNFDQVQGLSGLQQSLSTVNDTQRDAIVQSLQSVINQLQSQSSAASMPAGGYGAAANYGGYAAPVASAPAYSAPAYSAPVASAPVYSAPVQLPPLPPIQLPPVQLPAINIPAPAPPAPAPQPQQSFVEYGPVFNVPAPQPQTILVPVIVQQQPQRRHGCRLCNR